MIRPGHLILKVCHWSIFFHRLIRIENSNRLIPNPSSSHSITYVMLPGCLHQALQTKGGADQWAGPVDRWSVHEWGRYGGSHMETVSKLQITWGPPYMLLFQHIVCELDSYSGLGLRPSKQNARTTLDGFGTFADWWLYSFNVYSERSIVMEPVHISNVVVLHVNNLWVQVIAFQAWQIWETCEALLGGEATCRPYAEALLHTVSFRGYEFLAVT